MCSLRKINPTKWVLWYTLNDLSYVTYCMKYIPGSGNGWRILILHSRSCVMRIPRSEFVGHYHPEYRFLFQSRIRAQILANTLSWLGSNQISYPVNASRIPRCILVKPFQTLFVVWLEKLLKHDDILWNTRKLPAKGDAFSQHLRLFLTLRKTGFFLWFNFPCNGSGSWTAETTLLWFVVFSLQGIRCGK